MGEKMTIAEIKKTLKEDYGMKTAEMTGKNKEELEKLLDEKVTSEFEIEIDDDSMFTKVEVTEDTERIPLQTSPEWNDYVLSKFDDAEMVEGYPTCAGLRRVTELLIGPITECEVDVLDCPNEANQYRAVCKCTITVQYGYDIPAKIYSDVADVYAGNTDPMFARHAVASAATRAEGRALRKLLKLRVIAAEEVTSKPLEDAGLDGQIIPAQIRAIEKMSERLDINIWKFINMGEQAYKKISDVGYVTATNMIQHLNSLQQDTDKISESIKGYDKDWRNK